VQLPQTSEPVDFAPLATTTLMTLPEAGEVKHLWEFATPKADVAKQYKISFSATFSNQYVHVITDVFDITIDRVSGKSCQAVSLLPIRQKNVTRRRAIKAFLVEYQNRLFTFWKAGLIGSRWPDQ